LERTYPDGVVVDVEAAKQAEAQMDETTGELTMRFPIVPGATQPEKTPAAHSESQAKPMQLDASNSSSSSLSSNSSSSAAGVISNEEQVSSAESKKKSKKNKQQPSQPSQPQQVTQAGEEKEKSIAKSVAQNVLAKLEEETEAKLAKEKAKQEAAEKKQSLRRKRDREEVAVEAEPQLQPEQASEEAPLSKKSKREKKKAQNVVVEEAQFVTPEKSSSADPALQEEALLKSILKRRAQGHGHKDRKTDVRSREEKKCVRFSPEVQIRLIPPRKPKEEMVLMRSGRRIVLRR
jgi:hypothetical protein